MGTSKSKSGFNYGWVSYIGLFLCIFCTFGIASGTHSIYTPDNIARLGVSTTEYQSAVGTFSLLTGISCLLDGFLERKITARGILLLAVIVDALAFISLANSTDMTLVWVGYILLGLGNGFAFITVFSTITDAWFAKNKALMAGIIGFGANISTTLWTNLTRYVINTYGLQTSYYVFAVIMIVLGGLGVILVRNKPATIEGQIWYEPGITLEASNAEEDRIPIGTVLAEGLKNKKVVLALICTFFIGFIFNPISMSFTNVMTSKGFDQVDIAAMLGIYYLCIAVWKVIAGIITDNIGIRWTLLSIFGFAIIGLFILLNVPDGSVTLGYAAAIILGFAASATTYGTACMMMAAVPRHDYYVGMLAVTTFLVSICNAIAIIGMAVIFDNFGNYIPAVYIMIAFSVICLVVSMIFANGIKPLNKSAKERAAEHKAA
jgi:MFS family permease